MEESTSASILKMNPKEYIKYLDSYFSLCRKYELNKIEKQILLNHTEIRNRNGETLIYNYLLNKSCEPEFVEKMLENGHYL